jgi:fibronectin-binding autotransporter adhesin
MCLATLAATGLTYAADLTWDSSGSNPADPVDGSGTWDTSAALWSNGVSDAVWNNAGNDVAVFGNANGAAGTVTLGTAITTGGLVFNPATSGTYIISGEALTLVGTTPVITTNADAEISSVIAGSAGFVKTGSGKLTLAGANTYGGGVTIAEGTISFSSGANLPSGTSITFDGGTLQYTASSGYLGLNRGLVLTASGGTLDISTSGSGYINYSGPISYSGSGSRTLVISANSTSSQTSGLVSVLADGSGGPTSLIKNGSSSFNVSGANTYTGSTTVNAGILFLNGANRISSSEIVSINSGASIRMSGDQTFINLQDGSAGGGALTQAYNGSSVATIQSGSFSGRIHDLTSSRNVSLNKTTSGTLRLSGDNNSYTLGTTISEGTLLINNASGNALGTGSVTVTSATLGGNGFAALGGANSISVGTNGVITAGDSAIAGGIGTLTLNGGSTTGSILDMGAGSSFSFDLAAGDLNDTVRFYNYTGASDFLRDGGGVTLNFAGAQAGSYDLFRFYSDAGTTLTTAGFTELTSNFVLGSGLTGYTATWDYGTTGLITLNLVAIPEPTALGLALLGLAATVVRRRR